MKLRPKSTPDRDGVRLYSTGPRTFDLRQSRLCHLRDKKIVGSICATALRDAAPDTSALVELSSRDFYPLAVQALMDEAGLSERQLAPLTNPAGDDLQPFRAAIAFGVIRSKCQTAPFGLDNLRQIKTESSACALAACGVIDHWKTATLRVRAVILLRQLMRSRS